MSYPTRLVSAPLTPQMLTLFDKDGVNFRDREFENRITPSADGGPEGLGTKRPFNLCKMFFQPDRNIVSSMYFQRRVIKLQGNDKTGAAGQD
jgi:hypothetical protein